MDPSRITVVDAGPTCKLLSSHCMYEGMSEFYHKKQETMLRQDWTGVCSLHLMDHLTFLYKLIQN